MERLTKRIYCETYVKKYGGITSICYGCDRIATCKEKKCGFYKAIEKLAAYEDLGLEPEEIQDLKDCVEGEEGTEGTVNDLLELMRYRKLKAEGRLIKLPCKAYSKVYEIYTEYDEKNDRYIKGIEELLLLRFGKNQYNDYAVVKGEDGEDFIALSQFDKTVFLTREEAEKALKGAKNEQRN